MSKKVKIIRLIIFIITIIIMIGLTIYLLPVMKNLSTTEGQVAFKEKVNNSGIYGFLTLIGLQMAQIFLVILPGEPLEILAGMCYGAVGGTIFILFSVALTTTILFWAVRKLGKELIYQSFSKERIDKIENSKIFISPGNHDPYIKNSYYREFNWNKNVYIFKPELECVELEDIDIYGYGFGDFYCTNCGIEELEIRNKNKKNILVIHSQIDGANIEEKGFDYVAVGHIHKTDYNSYENPKIVYPGSLVSLGFDEIGKHGMILGEIKEDDITIDFIPLSENDFIEIVIDISEILSKEELIEKINSINLEDGKLVKIILRGKRKFEIDKYDIYKLIVNQNIIKINDNTTLEYNLEEMANNTTLKGLFIKEILKKKENCSEEELDIIDKAIEITFEALE